MIKYCIVSGTTKIGFSLGWVFFWVLLLGFFRWVYPKKTRWVFLGIYPGV